MINLYSINNTEYSKNGDATLQPLRCELTMAINGGWQLELELPYDKDEKWKLVEEGTVVRVTLGCVREQATVQQRFRVYDYRKTLTSLVAIAFPVAMESTQDAPIDNLAITNKTGVEAMALLQAKTNKYTLYTDITKRGTTSISNSNLNYAIASGESGCFIDVWGGECVYDNLTFKVLSQIGDKNNASKYPVIYGRNMTGIDYKRDDSGMVTRIYPISSDGIRLNGNGYVNSPIILNYPIVHARFMSAPYQLVIDKETDNSATATATRTALAAIKTASMTPSHNITISLISGAVRVPFDYIKKHKSGDENQAGIIDSVQAMATAEIYHETLKSKANKAIKDGMMDENNGAFVVADKYLEKNWEWHEDTSVTPHAWWYGYDAQGVGDSVYARNEYIKIGKYYEYFNNDGYWEEYKRISSIDLYHNDDGSWSIGYREGYYAHNEYVYMTINGQMEEWWYDSDGWYVADSSGASDFGWHGDSSSGIWFGEEDAGSEDKSKYLHDCWAFIDGTYYFFDQYGFTDADPVHSLPDYPWGRQVDEKTGKEWFGNTNKSIGAKWLYNQWIKLDGDYYYVDSEGYVRDENDSIDAVVNAYVTGLASLKTVCNTQRDTLYTLLYQQMTAWCNRQYEAGIDKPVVTIRVDMADLSKTDEYKNYAQLERICLGDVVECIDSEHGINTQERVIGLTYDCIRGYNKNIVIGHTEASLGSILSTNTGGGSVPSGFDTSAIETALTTQGNAIATLQNGKQDKLTAGENITIVNNVISATSGGGHGLEYWTETSEKISKNTEETLPQGDFMCDERYYRSYGLDITTQHNASVRHYKSLEEAPAICAIMHMKESDTRIWNYGIVISPNVNTAKLTNGQGAKGIEILGRTFYVNSGDFFQPGIVTDDDNLPDIGFFNSFNDGVNYLIANAGISLISYKETGIGVGNKVVWGGKRYSASDEFPFYVTDDGLVYGKKHISKGVHEGMDADANYKHERSFEIGHYLNGQGWSRCMVTRISASSDNIIIGYTSNSHPMIVVASLDTLDNFQWGWSNNTFNKPYGVTEWNNKDTYPLYAGGYENYFGYATGTVIYNGNTWNILLIDTYWWTGGSVMKDATLFTFNEYSASEPNVSGAGLALLQQSHATDHYEVVTEIGTDTYAFKYGNDDKIYTYIDTDGNALFSEITTDAGSLTSQMARKQNLLTAGENVQINGDTISATDTTYEEFDGDSAGLVPAVQTQSGKFLKDDGTWDDAGGGTEVEANPSGSATNTLTKLRVNDTIYGISGGGGASIIGLSMNEYRALTPTEKHDEDKLYMVETDEDITPLNMADITKYQQSSVSITSTSDTTTLTWNSGTQIGQTYYYTTPIDLTNVDKIRYTIVTGGCFNTDSGWSPNPIRDLGIGVRDTAPSGVILINSMNFAVYNEYKDTDVNSTFIDEELDVSGLSGNYYLIGTAAGWNAVITNIVLVNSIEQERRIYWDDKNWSSASGGGGEASSISLFNGTWQNQDIMGVTPYLATIEDGKLHCQGMHSGIVVSDVSGMTWSGGYRLIIEVESTSGFSYQIGQCTPTSDLDGIIRAGTNRITYTNDSVNNEKYVLKANATDATRGIFLGGYYLDSSTDYYITKISLVYDNEKEYS